MNRNKANFLQQCVAQASDGLQQGVHENCYVSLSTYFSSLDRASCRAAGQIHGHAVSHFYCLLCTTVLSTVPSGHREEALGLLRSPPPLTLLLECIFF